MTEDRGFHLPEDSAELFTIGYAGRTLESFVKILVKNDIERLVDVRLTPMSRARGFSMIALNERLRKAGIAYEHIAGLGNPPQIRQLFRDGDIAEGRRRFKRTLMNGKAVYVDRLLEAVCDSRTAILCVEADVEACHRLVVAEVAAEQSDEPLDVVHL